MSKVCIWLVILLASLSLVKCELRSIVKIPDFKANWFKAVEHCNSIGMQLAVIDSEKLEYELQQAMIDSHVYNGGNAIVWVGASDLAEEGNFHWIATGKPVIYSNWANNQPDNTSGEHCLEFGHKSYRYVRLNWQWNDNNCTVIQNFACQGVPL